eukprot:scaffold546_cov115-Cylindrotheca_fusiformis.AAC.2
MGVCGLYPHNRGSGVPPADSRSGNGEVKWGKPLILDAPPKVVCFDTVLISQTSLKCSTYCIEAAMCFEKLGNHH